MAERVRMRSAGAFDIVTKGLIAVNVAVFAIAALSGGDPLGTTNLHKKGALIGPSLRDPVTNEILRGVADGAWWRLITSGFLHYGPIHLLMNMYVLWTVGPALERELGRTRYLLVYLAALLGGAAGALLVSPTSLTAGASGAIFGMFGAFAAGLQKRGINPFKTGIGTTLLINLGLTFALSRYISVGGHLGGLVAGAICGWFMLGYPARRSPSWTYLVPIAVAVASVVIAFPAARRF